MDFIVGFILSTIIAVLSMRRQSLSQSGMFAAIAVGTIIYSFGSLFWYGVLLAFFISSSALSHFKKERKKGAENLFAKTGKRDASQVFANGGLAAILVVLAWLSVEATGIMYFYLGVMATVNADTWGTEIGVLSKRLPRHILTGKKLIAGVSGGISLLGTFASLLGAFFIGGVATILRYLEASVWEWQWMAIGSIAGLIGAFLDSVLGATVQRMYVCSQCNRETEKAVHCGESCRPIRGYRFATNDLINALSSLGGGVLAWVMWSYF
ncbi:DUF92 domain-containing protein [Ammoniphilus sp. YIM 78166]|uniref:DUF92 domain-containing protein n=1 Tax=Ammoniphilus sp. YIM 78166 TaxID=1644106 RepID=UPI00106F0F0C|nr:DUF92 domain-containing protein [Ammoniphilus sp. YIM 78166]